MSSGTNEPTIWKSNGTMTIRLLPDYDPYIYTRTRRFLLPDCPICEYEKKKEIHNWEKEGF